MSKFTNFSNVLSNNNNDDDDEVEEKIETQNEEADSHKQEQKTPEELQKEEIKNDEHEASLFSTEPVIKVLATVIQELEPLK